MKGELASEGGNSKKRVNYLEHFPPAIRAHLEKQGEALLGQLKQQMVLFYESGRYVEIIQKVFPILKT